MNPAPPNAPPGFDPHQFGPPKPPPGQLVYEPPPQKPRRPGWQRFLIATAITVGILSAVTVVGALVIVGLIAWACGHH